MFQIRGIFLPSLMAVLVFCQQTITEDCDDNPFCKSLKTVKNACVLYAIVKDNCRTMCGTCRDVYCADIPTISHGDAILSSVSPYKVGTTAKFTCDTGYRGVGEDTITCLSNGKWSEEIPLCKPVTICERNLNKLEKGRTCPKRCNGKDPCEVSFQSCQCNDWCGKSCFNQNSVCEALTKPKNGFIVGGRKTYARTVTYTCEPGYTLIGPSKRKCRSDRKWSGYEPFCVPFSSCGFTTKQTENTERVVRGSNAKKGAWPWQVLLVKSANYSVNQMYQKSVLGGGSVIDEEWVLSAAHIFTSEFPRHIRSKNWKNSLLLVFGMIAYVDQGLEIPEHIQIFEPAAVFLHPKFNGLTLDYDVALIRIGRKVIRGSGEKFIFDKSAPKVTFNEFIRPVCLPCMKGEIFNKADVWRKFDKKECVQKEKSIFPSFAATGSNVVVTGFGVINRHTGELANNLQEGRLRIVDPLICAKDIEEIKLRLENARYTKRMFCASGGSQAERIDSCQGDSGGPLVKEVTTSRRNSPIKYWMQLGIVSWGLSCATKHHGYYTSVPSIMSWVWKTLHDSRNGQWSNWGQWGACDVTCGLGVRERHRSCHGRQCVGSSEDETSCSKPPCKGWWSHWGQWGACDVTCGLGVRKRHRSCHGEQCDGSSEDETSCNKPLCKGTLKDLGYFFD